MLGFLLSFLLNFTNETIVTGNEIKSAFIRYLKGKIYRGWYYN
jgi:hypothetical protein